MYVGLELGTPSVPADERFRRSPPSSYLWSPAIILPNLICVYQICSVYHESSFKFYLVHPCITSMGFNQYTGLIDDYIMLAIRIGVGMLMKYLKFSLVSS